MKTIRDQFSDEVRKEMASKSGMAADEVYVSKWRFKQQLEFLCDYVTLTYKTTTSNLQVCLIQLLHIKQTNV